MTKMRHGKVMMTFNLTDRAATIADGWRLNRKASKMVSQLIEDTADRDLIDYAKPGDRRKIEGVWAEKSESGRWMVME